MLSSSRASCVFSTVITVNLVIEIENSTDFYEVSLSDNFCEDLLSLFLKSVLNYKI